MGDAMFKAIQDGGGFLGGTFNVLGEATRYCVLMLVMAIICFQAPSLASALTGGAAIQQGIQMIQNALMVAGLRAAGARGHAGAASAAGGVIRAGAGVSGAAGASRRRSGRVRRPGRGWAGLGRGERGAPGIRRRPNGRLQARRLARPDLTEPSICQRRTAMSFRKRLAASALLAVTATASPAQGIPVIDAANLVQTIQQVVNDITKINNQIQQITQLQTQIASMNGMRMLGTVANNPALQRLRAGQRPHRRQRHHQRRLRRPERHGQGPSRRRHGLQLPRPCSAQPARPARPHWPSPTSTRACCRTP